MTQALDGGADARQLARQTVDYLRNILMLKMGNDDLLEVGAETRVRLEQAAGGVSLARLLAGLEAFSGAAREGRSNWQPALPLELAFLESLESPSKVVAPPKLPDAHSSAPSRAASPAPEPRSTAPAPPRAVKKPAAADADDPATPTPAPSGPLSFQTVLDRWREILAATFEREPRAQALLNSGQPLALKNDQLIIGFASDLLREKMEKGETLKQVSAALEHVLGRPMGVQCVLSEQWEGAEPAPGGPLVEDGGMVDTALRELGAEVSELDAEAGGSSEPSET